MIDCSLFLGDDDRATMRMQHSCYERVVGIWIDSLIRHFEHAEALTGGASVVGTMIQHCQRFDHRAIQGVHDLIAAIFRHDRTAHPLFAGIAAWRDEVETEWMRFSRDTFGSLTTDDPHFARLCATAVALANTHSGMAAERELRQYLQTRYDLVPWKNSHTG